MVIVMLVEHITQSLNESARVKEKRMLFFRLSIELIESTNSTFVNELSRTTNRDCERKSNDWYISKWYRKHQTLY